MGLLRNGANVLVDTSAWIAILDASDADHEACRETYQRLRQSRTTLILTEMIMAETLTRLRYTLGFFASNRFHGTIDGALAQREVKMLWSSPTLFHEAWKIMTKYHDHKLSFIDCLTAAQAHQQQIKQIFTLDRDFAILGFAVLK